jgi:GntR family transcriptional regulator/MocR family aminotransferase
MTWSYHFVLYFQAAMAKESLEINPAGIRLSKNSGAPLYMQLYEQFRRMILSNRLRAGERLPASRNLAKELGVSRVIISQAYEQLIIEGYVVGKTGAGTFVADVLPDHLLNAGTSPLRKGALHMDGSKTAEKKMASLNRVEILPFQGGTPSLDFFPYKTWHAVANKVLKEFKKYNLGYDDTLGYWNLRKEIASYLRVSRAVKCEAEQVLVVTGSQVGLNLIAATLLQKGDSVWMEDPGYFGAKEAFAHVGVKVCPVPVERDGLNIDYAIENFPDARLAYITPSHQFPLGYSLSQSKRVQLLRRAHQHDMWILEDDYDSEFRYEGNPLPSLQGLDENAKVIYSGTFSKVLFPGLRLAYIVMPSAEMVHSFKTIKQNIDRQSPMMEQLILWKFMQEGHFLRHVRKMRLLYAKRQNILVELLHEHLQGYLRVSVAPAGMHLLCWLSEKIDVTICKREIKKQGLVVSFVDDYSLRHDLPPGMILGFTAFSKYRLKTGVEKLRHCILASLR